MARTPAHIRVNATFPFPALVSGSGPVTIGKNSGIWTVGYDVTRFAVANPPPSALATDYALVWDSAAGVFINVPLSTIAGAGGAAVANLFDTVASVQAATVSTANWITTSGHNTVGDRGGALYKRTALVGPDDGLIMSADGVWWQYVPDGRGINALAFGAVPDAQDHTPFDSTSGHFGAVSLSGTDSTAAIQSAINFGLRNKIRKVYLPQGKYLVSSTLHLGWGDTFYAIDLEGDGYGFSASLAGTVIIFSATDGHQLIDVAGGRTSRVKGISFFYPEGYYYISNNIWVVRKGDPLSPWIMPANPATWLSPTITNGLATNCPVAAITVDAFSGAQPATHYPTVSYPAWTGITTQYNKELTSGFQCTDCEFRGFPVAVAIGVNTNNQGDFAVFNNLAINLCIYGISICNTQSRNVDVHNINFQFVNTLLDGVSFGTGTGEWSGPVGNLSGGESYQIFNFNDTAGPMEISNVYSEGGLRRFGVWSSNQGLKLFGWVIAFGDSAYEMSRGMVETNTLVGEVTFERCTLNSHYGITNLVWGVASRTVLGSGNTLLCGVQFTDTTVLGFRARGYGGGFILNGNAADPLSQNKVRGNSMAAYPTSSGYALAAWSDTEAPLADSTYQRMYREGLRSFYDQFNREWPIKQVTPIHGPLYGGGTIAKTGGNLSGLSQTGDTLSFTYNFAFSETSFGHNNWGIDVGDILVDLPTGTLYVVKTGGVGVTAITCKQQNNYANYPGTGFVSAANVVTSGGSFRIIRTKQLFSSIVFFGDFTSGSANVANVHPGNLDGSKVNTLCPPGTLLFSPGINNSGSSQQPIANEFPVLQDTYIGTSTNGTGSTAGSLTLTKADLTTAVNAIATGRFPISPLGLRL